ncbi:MAG: hypothetical protein NVSMB48_25720 [Marmoricola sp.]
MPAFPAGLSSIVPPMAMTNAIGLLNQISGMLSGMELHPRVTVSRPVANRRISHGAAIAPRIPATPAAASVRPMVAGR